MRSRTMAFVLSICLLASAGSLIANQVGATAGERLQGCCICLDCGMENATTAGLDPASASCFPASGMGACESICLEQMCSGGSFENASCTDPSLAQICDPNVMAPAASPALLMALVGLLAACGAFYLRRRSA